MNTYIFYLITLTISLLFIRLYTSNGISKGIKRVYLFLSMLIPFFIMAFRAETGIDDMSYMRTFNVIKDIGPLDFYSLGGSMEPGYISINYMVSLLGGTYQWVVIVCATIHIIFMYKAFIFEKDKINLCGILFVFFTMHYFYYLHGIMRLSISVAIVAYSLRYLINVNKKKYYLWVVIAMMFHYSAIIMIFIPLTLEINTAIIKKIEYKQIESTVKESKIRVKIGYIIVFFLLAPLIFYIVGKVIVPIMPVRYHKYASSNMKINILGVLDKLPILIVILVYYKQMIKINYNNKIYIVLFILSFIIEMYSEILGIGRANWYFWISLCFLIPCIPKIFKGLLAKMMISILLAIYCFLYMYIGNFTPGPTKDTLVPYRNIYFEIKN